MVLRFGDRVDQSSSIATTLREKEMGKPGCSRISMIDVSIPRILGCRDGGRRYGVSQRSGRLEPTAYRGTSDSMKWGTRHLGSSTKRSLVCSNIPRLPPLYRSSCLPR